VTLRPAASVVLLVRDEIRTLPAVLEALLSQQQVTGDVELIAIDSGSSDGSRECLAASPLSLVQIPPHEFHHSRTRNLAARLARGEVVVWLSADAIPQSRNWLATLIAPFANPQVMGAYGRQIARPNHSPLQHFRLSYIYPATSCVRTSVNVLRGDERAYGFSDVNGCVRRSFWDTHQYPEDILIGEDVAMARTIIDNGYATAYVAEAVVEHSHDFTPREFFRRYFALGTTFGRIGLDGTTKGPKVRGMGLDYAVRELRWCFAHHGLAWGARSVASSLAKGCGYWLGRRHAVLPGFIKRRLEYRPRADVRPSGSPS
jgi:rhamnosyltransferase